MELAGGGSVGMAVAVGFIGFGANIGTRWDILSGRSPVCGIFNKPILSMGKTIIWHFAVGLVFINDFKMQFSVFYAFLPVFLAINFFSHQRY